MVGFLSINFKQSHAREDATSFIKIIEDSINVLQQEKWTGSIIGGKINNGLVELQVPENLVIVGDLHGDLESFCKILYEIDYGKFLSNSKNKIIFLGDYIDRGDNSIDILYNVCYLKKKYQNSVILMRGNHEAPSEFPFSSHDLPLKISERFTNERADIIYKKILLFFRLLTLGTIVNNKLFLVHGGLPTETGKNFKKLIADAQENYRYNTVLEELLWNDPRTIIQNEHDLEISRRCFGRHFGAKITRKWLDITGTKAVIRGHEPCLGFKIDHGDKIMTLFSCKRSYPKFEAAYILITANQLEKIRDARDLAKYVIKLKNEK